jgi:polysaccharide biosynthesis transport protein
VSLLHPNSLRPARTELRRRIAGIPADVAPPRYNSPRPNSALAELARFLRDHYLVLASTTVVGLLLGLLYAAKVAPVYRATATIEVQDLNENFLNLKEVASATAPVSAVNDLQTQLRIIQSRTMVARVIQRIGLPKTPGPLDSTASPGPPSDQQVEAVARGLQVRETRQSRIVDLTYESTDPGYTAGFVNELAQQYMDQSLESRLEISRGTSNWLERQLEDLRRKLTASEQRLQSYAGQSGLVVTNDVQRPDEEKLRQVQSNLSKAEENRMTRQARRDMAAAAPVESLEPPMGSPLRDHRTRLADLRRQRADLVAVYTPGFGAVKRLDAQIADLEATERKEIATLLQGIKNDYADAVQREKLLEASYNNQVRQVSTKASKAIQYGILKNEVNSNRELYNTMLHRAAEAKVASALRASSARLVDQAKAPQLPFKPSRLLSVVSGGTAGLLLGLVFAGGRDGRGRRIGCNPELAALLNVPDLGEVPNHVTPPVEAYRSILASILFSPHSGLSPQVIAFTSASGGEGKSHLVFKLAAVLSQMKRKVLLIDGSRNGELQGLFGQTRDYGLRDVVELSDAGGELLPYVTNPTRLAGVDLASLGPQDASALDLVFAEGMERLLEEIRRGYDLVLIDTPALGELPDARVFARMSDGVVLVVEAGRTASDALEAAARRLQWDGSVLLGTVLNRV